MRGILLSFKKEIGEHGHISFLIFIGFLFSILRIPSLAEPYWYGDEGIYEVVGSAIRHGRLLYQGIWDNKPPVLYLLYAVSPDQFSVRLLSLLAGLLSVVVFFYLAKKLFQNTRAVYFSTSLYALLFSLPLLEGNIANAENFMQLPTIAAFYLLFSYGKKTRRTFFSFAGLLLSLAFLIKITAIFDFATALVFIFIVKLGSAISLGKKSVFSRENFQKALSLSFDEGVFIASFFSPIALTLLFFAARGALSDFYTAAFSQNVGYVGYGNYFLIPQGLLYIKLALLAAFLLFLILAAKRVGGVGVFIGTWLAFSLFNAFFSARPYTHYVLVLLPSFCLLAGLSIESAKLRRAVLVACAVVILLLAKNFKFYGKVIPYYMNFTEFMARPNRVDAYLAFFDKNTLRDYELARIIAMKTKDGVFIWGDSPQIYALSGKLPSGRYTVAYHVTFYPNAISETREDIQKTRPALIIDIKRDGLIRNFVSDYVLRYTIAGADIYERKL